ncbi:nodulation factor exporter subunit NodI [mine drainage metagenome]|uniref:Nodulation factor exporter subunit NodI n=4 Tax=mine drainage metagenome TaxID=410659 RepID=T1BUI4_9ZZZZ
MPSAGTITVLDHPIPGEARQARRHIGVVPQSDNLDPDFSVVENLTVYARYFGLDPREIEQRIASLLDFAQLTDRARTNLRELSGGTKRRLTLIRALIHDPELIILDEPTTGLDPHARQHLWDRLGSLRAAGRTLILTTHYMEEAERLCDRVAIMDQGRVRTLGAPRELVERSLPRFVLEIREPVAENLSLDPTCYALERVGALTLVYASRREPLADLVDRLHLSRYIERPTNLEDCFLKLTGRELRE